MSNPVSALTLESIPWMSAKSLSHAMREVSLRGPNESEIWTRLIGRADMIAHSLNPKQAALVLNSLARIHELIDPQLIESFLIRFNRKFLPHLIPHASGLDAAQIFHGLSTMGKMNNTLVLDRVANLASQMDSASVSMCAAALSSPSVRDLSFADRSTCVQKLVQRFMELSNRNEQSLAQIFRACATVSGDVLIEHHIVDLCRQFLDMFENMSVRSLCVCLNSLAKMKNLNGPVVNEILTIVADRAERGDSSIAHGASILQLAVLLRSLQKLDIRRIAPLIDETFVKYMKMRETCNVPPRTACVMISALVEVPGTEEMIVGVLNSYDGPNMKFSPSEVRAIQRALDKSAIGKNLRTLFVENITMFSSEQMHIGAT